MGTNDLNVIKGIAVRCLTMDFGNLVGLLVWRTDGHVITDLITL